MRTLAAAALPFALALATTRRGEEDYQEIFSETSKTGFDIEANAKALNRAFFAPKGQPTKSEPWTQFPESVCGPDNVCCVCADRAFACLPSCDSRQLLHGKPWCRPCTKGDPGVDPNTRVMRREQQKKRGLFGILSAT